MNDLILLFPKISNVFVSQRGINKFQGLAINNKPFYILIALKTIV